MPDIRFSPEVENRYQFGAYCHRRGLLGTAMELGVHRGTFAGHFLAGWGGARYVAVDHYLPYTANNAHLDAAENYRTREYDKQIARATLIRFAERVEWKEVDTVHAVHQEPVGSVDFIYVDADHQYWAVMQEIEAAWPKIKAGGILAGHDFCYACPDVMRAVKEFSARLSQVVWLTMDDFQPWSWFMEKPA